MKRDALSYLSTVASSGAYLAAYMDVCVWLACPLRDLAEFAPCAARLLLTH
jgi:hypothetical protein